MTMHTENWVMLALKALPIVLKIIFGKKATQLDFLACAKNEIIPRARARRRA